ncbi:SGNH/GDSL hydrolase family protein [Streptacidiphilus jiangxiensis]|uniref:GDSL-like Lipase/Acylhydrolase family protein n=1 Tax=Streptacidiphilus jiangxiensis TaxID=235985 RepID=A0A1H7I3P7_STRJI|nr:SGNH/GDSL hydrolase family protein [Streptacidiphilus jiangxiensis]SEK57166.1 GDSL-like Lipase/Acylhydrolase family protein [Streptacidiphilus jiangxiensis]
MHEKLWRAWVVVLMALACTMAGAAGVSAAAAGRPSVNGPVSARAGSTVTAAHCELAYSVLTDCSSHNPQITMDIYNFGDTSACTFKIHMDWGDGGKGQDFTKPGGPNGREFLADHAYGSRGVYHLTMTGSVVSGPCGSGSASYTFRLRGVTGKLRLAALGDSYSSGEGAGNYDRTTPEGCHRSADAWARLLLKLSPRTLTAQQLIACSGATSAALEGKVHGQPNQLKELQALRPAPDLVTLSMGGNDVGFSKVLTDCFLIYVYGHGDCDTNGTLTKAADKIKAEQPVLAADYAAVRAADPTATILVVGYPRLFPAAQQQVDPGCHWLTDDKRAGLNALAVQLNGVIRAAAAEAGVNYVDVSRALNGHEACARDPWVVPIHLGLNQEMGHPTYFGQYAIARLVNTYIGRRL